MNRDIKVFSNFKKRVGRGHGETHGRLGNAASDVSPSCCLPTVMKFKPFLCGCGERHHFLMPKLKGKRSWVAGKNAFCMPALSWPQFQSCWKKFPDADDSWAPRLEFRWSEKENYTPSLGSGGARAACEMHKGPSAGLPPVHLHPRSWAGGGGVSVGEEAVKRRRDGGEACVSMYLRFPPSCSMVSGVSVTFTPCS